jgi:hypothetical protein
MVLYPTSCILIELITFSVEVLARFGVEYSFSTLATLATFSVQSNLRYARVVL